MDHQKRFFVMAEGDCDFMPESARQMLALYHDALRDSVNYSKQDVENIYNKFYEFGNLVEIRGAEILLKHLLENPIPRDPNRRKNSPATDRAITRRIKLIQATQAKIAELIGEAEEEHAEMLQFSRSLNSSESENTDINLEEDLEWLVANNKTILAAIAITCNTVTNNDPATVSKEYALEIKPGESGTIVLTKEDVAQMALILHNYKPAE